MKLKSWLVFGVFFLTVMLVSAPAQEQKKPTEQKPAQKPPAKEEKEDEGQTIKLGTQLVNVLFSVTDKQNRYLNELSQNDITILEDGKAQKVFIFKRETDLPLTLCFLIDVSGSTQYILPRLKDGRCTVCRIDNPGRQRHGGGHPVRR